MGFIGIIRCCCLALHHGTIEHTSVLAIITVNYIIDILYIILMEGIAIGSILAFTYVVSCMLTVTHRTIWLVYTTRTSIIHLVPEVREGGLICHELGGQVSTLVHMGRGCHRGWGIGL